MKKKLLFVIPSLDSGGGEKALINLLNILDYSKYEVTVLLFKKRGLFLDMVPQNVTVNSIQGNYEVFTQSLFSSLIEFLFTLNFSLFFHRKLYFLKRLFNQKNPIFEQNSWVNISKSIPFNQQEFDVAISFLEKSSLYYIVDKVNAKKKIAWVHTNYSKSGLNPIFDYNYFSKIDHIVTVSEECKNNLIHHFPFFRDKTSVIYNVISSNLVKKLAQENINDENFKNFENSIITVARLSHEKGIDIAVECCKKLVEVNKNIIWYVIGDGNERQNIEHLIKKNNLENNFKLLGLKQNPYPFVNKATIFVQPSRYEGKSIAIDEAKILAKPIITTNYESAKDQIDNNINGLISNTNPSILAKDILNLLNDNEMQNRFSLYLSQNQQDMSVVELNKINNLFN